MIAAKLSAVLKSRTPELVAGDGYKPAGVLIPVQERPDDDYLVLTQRGEELPTHKGQIAFPGGRVHVSDKDIFQTALREAHEEIGIDPRQVEVLGRLDEFTAGYGLVVTPVVGLIPAHCEFRMDPRETTAVAAVPIQTLLARGNFVVDEGLSPGGHPSYHFYVNGWDVWGVTARILVQFLDLVYDFCPNKN